MGWTTVKGNILNSTRFLSGTLSYFRASNPYSVSITKAAKVGSRKTEENIRGIGERGGVLNSRQRMKYEAKNWPKFFHAFTGVF